MVTFELVPSDMRWALAATFVAGLVVTLLVLAEASLEALAREEGAWDDATVRSARARSEVFWRFSR